MGRPAGPTEYRVPIRSAPVRRQTYIALTGEARARGMSLEAFVGYALDRLAEPAEVPDPPARPRNLTDEEYDTLRDLYAREMSDTAIAVEMSRSQPTVSAARRRLNLGPAHGKPGRAV